MEALNFNANNYTPYEAPEEVELGAIDTSRNWSQYQRNIFDWVRNAQGNAIVEAVAGSGKSTTAVEAIKHAQNDNVIFLAFNKSIAAELKARGVNARTFHSLTFGATLRFAGVKDVDMNKLSRLMKANFDMRANMMYGKFAMTLVGLAKQMGIGCLRPNTFDSWNAICNHHDMDPDHEEATREEGIEVAQELLAHSVNDKAVDFDDMLYYPVLHRFSLPKWSLVIVDEAQDTNPIQRALIKMIIKPHGQGRLMAIGDPAQSIYGFRGADSNAMTQLAQEFNCVTLPLSVTYRCPTSVVEVARGWVNHILPAPGAPEGHVEHLGHKWTVDTFRPYDLVVCRRTAPLMMLAFRMLRARVRFNVMGRDIGKGLKSIIRKMNTTDIRELEVKLERFREREVEKCIAKEDPERQQAIEDKVYAILTLTDSLETGSTTHELYSAIDDIFEDRQDMPGVVTLTTIHKAKGLEADRVFWLDRDNCPSPWAKQEWQKQQEINLCYVAATRAKLELYYLSL